MTEGLMDVATTAPTNNGDAPLPKRQGPRQMLPAMWLGRHVILEWMNADGRTISSKTKILDFCGFGIVVTFSGDRTLLPWEAIKAVTLREGA